MHALRHHRFAVEDYLDLELESEGKFEYCDGAILAMAGGSLGHNRVSGNTFAALHARFRGRCQALPSDQRVVTGDGVYTYPDAAVVCGKPEISRYKGTDTLHNPVLLVEVLSPSTRDYDLGEKLEHYQTIPSLVDVLFIDPDVIEVTHVGRTAEGWETRTFTSLEESVELVCAGAHLPLAEVYATAEE